jgi:hypothetical protein
MITFYKFYTIWSIIIGIGCIISLGFILAKYHIYINNECKVNAYTITYDLYDLIIFLLISTIFTNFIQTIGYFNTRNDEYSTPRKFINFINTAIFIVQILGICAMIYKFNNNHHCFKLYNDELNGKVMIISFIALSISYMIQIIFIICAFISIYCCNKKYSIYQYDYEYDYV